MTPPGGVQPCETSFKTHRLQIKYNSIPCTLIHVFCFDFSERKSDRKISPMHGLMITHVKEITPTITLVYTLRSKKNKPQKKKKKKKRKKKKEKRKKKNHPRTGHRSSSALTGSFRIKYRAVLKDVIRMNLE